jgi:phage shock protein E
MQRQIHKSILVILAVGSTLVPTALAAPKNPNIDMPGYLKVAATAASHRELHLVSEAEFIQRSRQPGTIILDARSREKYDLLHIQGAINLSFSDIDVDSLQRVLPDKNAQILIYCNNNFGGEPIAFPSKMPSASLNLSTYIALYNYGYRNVYELAPFVEVNSTKLPLVKSQP